MLATHPVITFRGHWRFVILCKSQNSEVHSLAKPDILGKAGERTLKTIAHKETDA